MRLTDTLDRQAEIKTAGNVVSFYFDYQIKLFSVCKTKLKVIIDIVPMVFIFISCTNIPF